MPAEVSTVAVLLYADRALRASRASLEIYGSLAGARQGDAGVEAAYAQLVAARHHAEQGAFMLREVAAAGVSGLDDATRAAVANAIGRTLRDASGPGHTPLSPELRAALGMTSVSHATHTFSEPVVSTLKHAPPEIRQSGLEDRFSVIENELGLGIAVGQLVDDAANTATEFERYFSHIDDELQRGLRVIATSTPHAKTVPGSGKSIAGAYLDPRTIVLYDANRFGFSVRNLDHEMGHHIHALDWQAFRNWRQAIATDQELAGSWQHDVVFDAELRSGSLHDVLAPVGQAGGITSYGTERLGEDIAESLELLRFSRRNDGLGSRVRNGVEERVMFEDLFPARTSIMFNSPRARAFIERPGVSQ